jgi:hypothetical protein
MRPLAGLAALALLVGLAAVATAGDAPDAAGADDEPVAAGAPATAADDPPAPIAPVEPAGSAAQLRDQYDAAFGAMLAGDFVVAAAGFDQVAAASSDPELAAAAAELARLARDLSARGLTLASAAAPAPPSVSATLTPDDARDAGRVTFIVSTTIASLYTGVVLLDLADIGDFRAGVLVVTGATAAGFLGSLYGSRGRNITAAMGDAYTLGLGSGLANGALLASPIGLDSRKQVETFILGTVAVGGAAGLLWSDAARPTRGQVTFAGNLAIMGMASTWLALGIVQPDDLRGDTVLLLTAGGYNAGLATGIGLSSKLEWSHGRARLVGLGSFLGALGGFATAALITGAEGSGDAARMWSTTTLVGLWGGFALSTHLTRNMRPDPRFTIAATPTALVTPTVIRDAPGLAVSGAW